VKLTCPRRTAIGGHKRSLSLACCSKQPITPATFGGVLLSLRFVGLSVIWQQDNSQSYRWTFVKFGKG